MKKTTEATKDQTPKTATESKLAKAKKAARGTAKADTDAETADRLPTTLKELKETKGGFVAHLFLTGVDKDTIAKELATAFKLAEPQALKITRRISGRVRLYARVFQLVGEKASTEPTLKTAKPTQAETAGAEPNETLRDNMEKWLSDRQYNGDPLKFNEFVRIMVELGHDRKAALALKDEMNSAWTQMKSAK
jgi:hypothetical protein